MNLRLSLSASTVLLASLALQTQAADVTWDTAPGAVGAGNGTITGGTGTWDTTTGNWTTDAGANNVAWVNANNDKAIFGGTGDTVTLGTAITAGGLQFDVAGYTLSGSTLTLAGTPGISVASGATATINSIVDGTADLAKSGDGILVLGSANSYTGKISINGGTISVNGDDRLGTAPGAYVADQLTLNGGILKVTGTSTVAFSANRGFTLGASGGTLDNTAMANNLNANFNGQITGSGPLALRANGDTSVSGGGVGGNLYLGNSGNDFTGGVTIHSGVVSFNGDSAFGNSANVITIAGGGLVATTNRTLAATRSIVLSGGGNRVFRVYGSSTFNIEGNITGSGNIYHTDGGTLALKGDNSFTGHLLAAAGITALSGNNSYTGYTHLTSGGTLRLDANNVMPDTTDVLQYGNNTFNVNGKTETIRALVSGSSSDTTATLNLGAGGSLTVTHNAMTGSGLPGHSDTNYYGKISGTGDVEYAHSSSNTASWILNNTASDFTGNLVITHGRLRAAINAGMTALGNASNDIVFNGAVVGGLSNGGGSASFQGATGASIVLGADRDIVINSGKEGTMYVWGGQTYTVDGKVTGGGNLRKEDGGTLLLNNTANDYGGMTRIATGTIQLGNAGVLPDGTTVEMAGGTLDTNGKIETVAALMGAGGNLGGGGSLIVTTTGSANFAGSVTGNTTVVMNGSGTQTLSGTGDNSGGKAEVNSGTLVLAKASSGSVHAAGASNAIGATITGGTLQLAGTGDDQIYLQTNVSITGGSFDFNGRNEGFNALLGNGGVITNSASATTSVMTLGQFNGGGTYSGIIQNGAGTMAVTKTGSGTQVFAGNNTYSGGTTISGGIVRVAAFDNALGTGGIHFTDNATLATELGGGARNLANGISIDTGKTASFDGGYLPLTLSGVISGDGGTRTTSAGTVIFTGANTYTGGTEVTSGTTLLINNTTGSGTGTGTVTVASGGTLGGTGAISGNINVTGTLSPGASIESLGTGALSFDAGSALSYELNSSAISGDLVYSTGALNLTGLVTLNLSDMAPGTLSLGSKLTLVSYGGAWNNGLFTYLSNSLADDSTFTLGANQWIFNYNDTAGGTNFTSDQTGATGFVTMTVVPEPSATLLGGLGALFLLRRRRNG